MSRPMIRIHDTQTGEIINREMTDDEFAIYEKDLADAAKEQAKKEATANAKMSAINKLQDLGLTEEEAKAFLG